MDKHAAKREEILEAFRFRHATKRFDPEQKITEEDFAFLLETVRLSPSSCGYEPWQLLVVQNPELREKLRGSAWGAQGQLPTASHFVVFLVHRDVRYDSDYVIRQMKEVKGVSEEDLAKRMPRYREFQESDFRLLDEERHLVDWAGKQAYIALGNMMTAAAMIGIDSCPIEGFDMAKIRGILDAEGLLDNGKLEVCVMAAFGYRVQDPAQPKTRRELESLVRWVE